MIAGLFLGAAVGLFVGLWMGAKHPVRVLRDGDFEEGA